MTRFDNIKTGDWVTRMVCGTLPMQLRVTEVTPMKIVCGAWEFDRGTGAEIDDELGWPRTENGVLMTGSILVEKRYDR